MPLVNLKNIAITEFLASRIINDKDIFPADVMILMYYAEQMRVIERPFNARKWFDFTLKTVDSQSSREFKYVILDLVSPGGEFGLGFLTSHERPNLAVTRARAGLIIVGNRNMTAFKHGSSVGQGLLKGMVDHHEERGQIFGMDHLDTREIRRMLNFPGGEYEPVEKVRR